MNTKGSAADWISRLQLQPHPEGGYYRQLYRSEQTVTRDGVNRSAITTIYYLLERGQFSRWHDVASDEIWHFVHGDPLELFCFDPERKGLESVQLGALSGDGNSGVHVVPARHWQAARPTGEFSLVGCTVGPGFEFEDFRFVSDIPGHEEIFATYLANLRSLL